MLYIKINDLSLSFKEQIIFNKARLTIDSPGFYCLMGRNGCGKSTLFRAILNDVEYQEGSIEIYGGNEQVSFCMADPIVFENLTVYENLKLISSNDDKIRELAHIFGIESILYDKSKKCSAGEKQRICLIRALIEDKPIILLDEATSHLDDYNSTKALDYIKELSKDNIIIYSTHYEYEALKYADAYIKIKDNKIILDDVSEQKGKIKLIKASKYYPKKIFKKIICWKPDYVFSTLLGIALSIVMIFIWLLNITPAKVYQQYQGKTKTPEYTIIDDREANPYNCTSYDFNKYDKDLTESLFERNNKFKSGVKCFRFQNVNLYVDYFLFDESLDDDFIKINEAFYKTACYENFISNGYLNLESRKYKIEEIIQGDFLDRYFICNQNTFRKIVLADMNFYTVSNTKDITLTDGRMPENKYEIILADDASNKIGSIYKIEHYGVYREYTVVGYFKKIMNSKGVFITYITTDDGYDFYNEASVFDICKEKIAYANVNDITYDDYKYILSIDYCLNNDVSAYSYKACKYIITLKRPIIIASIFVFTFAILFLTFYFIYWNHENNMKYHLIKLLKKTNIIKKRYIIFKALNDTIFLIIAGVAYYGIQNIVNHSLMNGTTIFVNIDNFSARNYFFNSFLIYIIPMAILIVLIVTYAQIRRVIKC